MNASDRAEIGVRRLSLQDLLQLCELSRVALRGEQASCRLLHPVPRSRSDPATKGTEQSMARSRFYDRHPETADKFGCLNVAWLLAILSNHLRLKPTAYGQIESFRANMEHRRLARAAISKSRGPTQHQQRRA